MEVQGDHLVDVLQNITPICDTDDIMLIGLMDKRHLACWRPEGEGEN